MIHEAGKPAELVYNFDYSQFIDRIVKEGLSSWELAITCRALTSEKLRIQVKLNFLMLYHKMKDLLCKK